jgi:Phage-related minor tail protein
MGNKPAVTLTLAADEKKVVDSFDRAGKAGGDMADKITSASRQVEQAGKRVGDVSDHADRAGKSFDGMSDKFSSASATMVAKAAVIGASVMAAFQNVFAQSDVGGMLAARLGGGAERAAQLGAIAGKVYGANFGESMQDVGEALRNVIGANLIDEDAADADIQHMTEKLLTVAQVVGEETGRVSQAVQQMLRTGLAKSADEAFDLIVRAQQQGLNKSEDLLDTLNEYGTQFRKLGLDGPMALGLINQALQAGARDSDTAADALKEFSIRAIDGSKASQNAFHDLGLNGEQMAAQIARGGDQAAKGLDTVLDKLRGIKDPVVQAQIAVGLFGTKAEDLGAALLAMDTSTAVDSMGTLTGATDAASTALGETAGAKMEAFKRNMEQSLVAVVTSVLPLLEAFGRFVSQNADVLGPLALAVGVVTVAQWAWNAALAANPIILLVGLLAGLVIAFVQLWNKSAAFRDFFIDLWDGIKNAVVAAGQGIGEGFKFALNLVIGYLNWWVDRVNNIIGGINAVSPFGDIPPLPHISKFHTGGTVPGDPGTERLAMVRAGERIDTGVGGGSGGTLRVTGSGALVEIIQAALNDGTLVLVGR